MPTSRPQPRGLHALPALWRVHRVHHADSDFDYSTAFRVHPLEAMTTVVTLMVVVWMLGVPPLAVVIHQTLSTASTILEHANVRLPAAAEAVARTVLVPPDLYRIHHSATPEETDTNFATIPSVWDRWLGTYRAQPAAGHERMEIGLKEFREPKYLTLPWTLALPFSRWRARLRARHQRDLPGPCSANATGRRTRPMRRGGS